MAYTITGRKSGTVRFLPEDNGIVQTESASMTSRVTSNPIESGADLHDHVINDAEKFSISGTIIGGNSAIAALKSMRDKRDILTYTGRTRASNLVITSLTFDFAAKNKDGCAFKVQFQQVFITSAEVVEVGEVPMSQQDAGKASTPQANKTSNAGTQTAATQSISGSAYASYVASYSGTSSAGPATRTTASYSGVK